jgi:uncharacterized membrane protein YhfC
MLFAAYFVNPLLMLALPIVLGLVFARRLGTPWRLAFIGAATFIGSQVVHIPLNLGLDRWLNLKDLPIWATAIVLGLSAGLCEEVARYLVYRFWLKDAREWRQALMFGLGHGGVEAILLGIVAAWGALNLLTASQLDLTTLGLTPEQLATAQSELAQALSFPAWFPLLGSLERALALINHLALSVLVLQAFKRRAVLWLLAAIVWHAALDAVAVYSQSQAVPALGMVTGSLVTEGLVLLFALGSLAMIWALREPYVPAPAPAPAQPLPLPAARPLKAGKPSAEALDKSRYQ